MTGLEDVFDIVDIAAKEERAQILLNRLNDGERPLGEGGAAETEQAVIGRVHPHDHERQALGGGDDRPDGGDPQGVPWRPRRRSRGQGSGFVEQAVGVVLAHDTAHYRAFPTRAAAAPDCDEWRRTIRTEQ